MLSIPAVVRDKAMAVGADSWLTDLPDLVATLERDWSIVVGPAYPNATEAFVAQAIMADGTPAVLKVMLPRHGSAARDEITVLRLAEGDGCPRLLRADVTLGAQLTERLGRPLVELGLPLLQPG